MKLKKKKKKKKKSFLNGIRCVIQGIISCYKLKTTVIIIAIYDKGIFLPSIKSSKLLFFSMKLQQITA